MPFIESTLYYFSHLLFSTFMCCCAKWHIYNLVCEWTRELLGFAFTWEFVLLLPPQGWVSPPIGLIGSPIFALRLLQHPNSHLPFFLIVILWWGELGAVVIYSYSVAPLLSVFNDAVWELKVAMIREGCFFFLGWEPFDVACWHPAQ